MKILFLDDNETRQKKFCQNAIGFTTCQARTAREAVKFMRKHDDFDLIMLDHDLDYRTANKLIDDEEDGRWVCRKMVEKDFHKEAAIVIHSMNPIGAEKMAQILEDGGYKNVNIISCAWMKLSKNEDGGITINDSLPESEDFRDYM